MILALAVLVTVDLTVTVSPEPLAVTRARFGDVRGMGTWRCVICAEASAEPVRVSALRVETAIDDLAVIDPESAAELLRITGRMRRREVLARVLEYSALAATAAVGGGYIRVTSQEAARIGLAITGAQFLRGRAEKGVIVLNPDKLLTGTIEVPPGGCAARIFFAGLVKNARPRRYRLTITEPRRPVIPTITSVP